MIPGSAIGRMTTSEIVSRPKKRYRDTRERDQRPEHERDRRRAERRLHRQPERVPHASSWYATENHFVEKSSIGQLCVTLSLKA